MDGRDGHRRGGENSVSQSVRTWVFVCRRQSATYGTRSACRWRVVGLVAEILGFRLLLLHCVAGGVFTSVIKVTSLTHSRSVWPRWLACSPRWKWNEGSEGNAKKRERMRCWKLINRTKERERAKEVWTTEFKTGPQEDEWCWLHAGRELCYWQNLVGYSMRRCDINESRQLDSSRH